MTTTSARPGPAREDTIRRPRRRTRMAVDAAGLAYVIAVYVAVVTRGRVYVHLFHELDRVVLHPALGRAASFMFALVGDVSIDVAAAILVTGMMVCRKLRVRE